jgi:hypothetical protein
MKPTPRAVLLALGLAAGACTVGTDATVITLLNDGFTSGTPAFQGGFMAGEGVAAVFPPRASSFEVRGVRFPFGGGGTAQTVTLALYLDDGTLPVGAPLHSQSYPLTPSNSSFQFIDLSAANVTVPAGEGLRVALMFAHDGYPGVARDDDGLTANRNLVYTASAWTRSETVGVLGDWIIRADIEAN